MSYSNKLDIQHKKRKCLFTYLTLIQNNMKEIMETLNDY